MRALLPSMKSILALALAAVACLTCGCGSEKAPPEISTSQIAAGAPDVFKGASAETQKLAAEAVEAIGKQDFTTAWEKLQTLNATPNLTEPQKEFVAASIASVGAEVNKAEESGNEVAQEALKFHRANK